MKVKSLMLIGLQASGKGTQSKLLVDKLGYKHIGVGDILREEQHKDTERGRLTKELIGTGQLFPDDVINNLMTEVLSEYIKNNIPFVLEGYPRTLPQAIFMDSILKLDKIIFIKLSEDESIKRLLERGKTSGREDDSSLDVIKYRLEQFKSETYPIKEYFEKSGILSEIDGEQTIETIFSEIKTLLN